MWIIILGLVLTMAALAVIYLCSRIGRFSFIKRFAGESKLKRRIASLIVIGILYLLLYICIGGVNAIVSVLHLTAFWLICDLVNLIVSKIRKRENGTAKAIFGNTAGVVAVVLTVCYLIMGYYIAGHVVETDYKYVSEKVDAKQPIKVAWFSDSHVGALFDGDELKEYCDRISATNPDVMLIVGDFIDDSTTKEDMIKSCEAVGSIQTKYGIYFVFGNHDKGYYASQRGYTGDDLKNELVRNGVIVLEDESVLIDDRFYIIGRQDASERTRMDMNSLIEGLDKDKYMIVMDHQPTDYDSQADSKVDLVISGHTHGGQLIPVIKVGEWAGINDSTYGYERRQNTDFIVSSGIADWEIIYKTGCISEYVIMDITGSKP